MAMALRKYFKGGRITPRTETSNPTPLETINNDGSGIPSYATSYRGSSGLNSRLSMRDSTTAPTSHMSMDLVKHKVMINHLYGEQEKKRWRDDSNPGEGVMLRLNKDNYVTCPPSLLETPLVTALRALNVQVAMTVNSEVIKAFLYGLPNFVEIPLMNGLRVQVVETVEDLAHAKAHQFAACIASESLLVVWDDDAFNVLTRAKAIEFGLIQLLWSSDTYLTKATSKMDLSVTEREVEAFDPEDPAVPQHRPAMFIQTVLVATALCILIVILGLGVRALITELMIEKGVGKMNYTRFAFLAVTPIWLFFGMFFAIVLVLNIAQLVGPIRQMTVNSKFYSATRSPRLQKNLPHVTIQCPVYKEGLKAVIAPTIQSIKEAISTYELQGGSANIFINDDGLQLLSREQCETRMDFYRDHSIGWVARPGHSSESGGFQRRGKFKKASNMNFALDISCSVEDKLKTIERPFGWTRDEENAAAQHALEETIAEGGGIAWAAGNIRIGDYILIIDSDTRVPSDCLLDAVSELETSPEVAVLQFSSGVMQVVHNYFENGITFFTNLIYSAIRFGVANGDVAPFVGHNAVLRWSALQEIAFVEDGKTKFWSESHVSEDFDVALRLQIAGYITRLAAWAGDGFKEGVSLTVYDELARWQKYAYGCNELIFHPIRFWPVRGPFTPLWRKFLFSNMPFAAKISIIAYVGTYYAIGAAWILTVVNYFVIGWFKGYIDKYYIPSWQIWVTVILVFNGLGNVSLAVMRYRLRERSFLGALIENFKWLLMLFIFLGGISIHISQALLCHMFEINMTWSATAKEVEVSNFFVEIPRVLRRFWFSMSFSIVAIAGLIIMARADFIPHGWAIKNLEPIIPMSCLAAAHLLLPLALNPPLMTFMW